MSEGGWNIETIKALIEEHEKRNVERFESMKTAVDAALMAADRAVNKAEVATEKRFEGVNEFRAALSDQAQTLLARSEYSVQHRSLIERIDGLERQVAAVQLQIAEITTATVTKTQGLGFLGSVIMGLVALASVIVALVAFVTRG